MNKFSIEKRKHKTMKIFYFIVIKFFATTNTYKNLKMKE